MLAGLKLLYSRLVIATCGCLNYHEPVNGRDTGTVMNRLTFDTAAPDSAKSRT